jgi:hypothetical protein
VPISYPSGVGAKPKLARVLPPSIALSVLYY